MVYLTLWRKNLGVPSANLCTNFDMKSGLKVLKKQMSNLFMPAKFKKKKVLSITLSFILRIKRLQITATEPKNFFSSLEIV